MIRTTKTINENNFLFTLRKIYQTRSASSRLLLDRFRLLFLYNEWKYWSLFGIFLFRITLVSSIFLIVGTGIERYLAVCRPHHYHRVIYHIIIFFYIIRLLFRSRTNLIVLWLILCQVSPLPSSSIYQGKFWISPL